MILKIQVKTHFLQIHGLRFVIWFMISYELMNANVKAKVRIEKKWRRTQDFAVNVRVNANAENVIHCCIAIGAFEWSIIRIFE